MSDGYFFSLDGPLDTMPVERQVRAGNLTGFGDLVRNLGGDPRRMLERHDIDPRAMRDPDSYVDSKAIVELFCGYQDCMGEDEDGDTTFLITKFIQIRPDSYRQFYFSFFQGQLDALEHFGFLEFLNLTHSAANDSQ